MDINRLLTALKDTMEAEMTGHQFYFLAAKTTGDAQGKATFARMAQEELDHFHALKTQYIAVLENGKFD
jgi:rubrerythrin